MLIKLFTIPITSVNVENEELNKFLRGNKIIEVKQKMVSSDNSAYWCFIIKYLERQINQTTSSSSYSSSSGNKKDYSVILNAEQFELFSEMRIIRKQLAAADSVPAYFVFTDEELSEISKMPEIIPAKMIAIKGIGDKKIEKYGEKLCQSLKLLQVVTK